MAQKYTEAKRKCNDKWDAENTMRINLKLTLKKYASEIELLNGIKSRGAYLMSIVQADLYREHPAGTLAVDGSVYNVWDLAGYESMLNNIWNAVLSVASGSVTDGWKQGAPKHVMLADYLRRTGENIVVNTKEVE